MAETPAKVEAKAPPVAQGQGDSNRSSVQIDSVANRRAIGFRWADKFDFRRAEEPVVAVVVVVVGKGADSFGPFEEIEERESASCQQKQTVAAAAGWTAASRERRAAGGNRRLRDERCLHWTRAKVRDWAYHYSSIHQIDQP